MQHIGIIVYACREREQSCTVMSLHVLDHLTWAEHQLKAKGVSVLNEQQLIFLSTMKI
jgi:hypothetical protein